MKSGGIGREDVERRGELYGIYGKAEGVAGDSGGFVGAEENHEERETGCAYCLMDVSVFTQSS